ncbi:MAG: transcription termination/antitermination protein NusA [Oligoflexia bacterium]|nr:transcription termination factor NusA [Bdellovibrionales bacterium]MYE07266.1 transcription termination/antitermination protein NusA [Oligoflexia bacterium]
MSTITNTFSELGRLIDQVSKDRGLDKKVVINSIVQGLLSAARKKYGTYRDIEVKYNEETGQIELYEFKEVVEDKKFIDDQIEIKLSEALKLDPETRVADQIGVPLESEAMGRIDAYMAKQIVVQNLKDAENEMVFNEFEKRKGEIVSGVVRRVDRGMIVVDLEKIEAYIPKKEQIYGEKYNTGDRIQGYILEVRQTNRGPQIIMSRAHPNYLIKLFEKEVPEIYEGIVKVVSAAREVGQRAKIAVYSTDSAVHPVGACVGMKGNRVQNITQELKGERIDVIVWDEDPIRFVCNTLAPAKISKVLVDEENKEMEIIVPDDQLSLAIGKKGQNVRLAVNLTKWNLNIVSLTEFEENKTKAVFNLKLLPGITDTMAENIYQFGIDSFQELAKSSVERVQLVPGFDQKEKAEQLIQSAKDLIIKYKEEGVEIPSAPSTQVQKKAVASGENMRVQADRQLKEELAQLESSQSHQKIPADEMVSNKEATQKEATQKDSQETDINRG